MLYDFVNVDPEGDGGGTRFVFLVVFGLVIYGGFRVAQWISQGMRREPRGFAVDPLPPPRPPAGEE
ncbi:MAG TPA: hypothetical protein VH475_05610 [Tepidisphaeraceae bacterium]